MTFWLILAGLTLLALAFAVPPFFSRHGLAAVERKQVNIALYKERLAELEQLELPPEQLEQARQELEKDLLQDIATPETSLEAQPRARWGAWVAALLVPGLAAAVYIATERHTPQQIQAALERPQQTQHSKGAPSMSMEDAVARLEQKLQEQPDNSEGWHMLARSYEMLERYPDAAKAYEKVLDLGNEDNADLLADYAEALGLAQNSELKGKPTEVLQHVLTLNPEQPKALWLLGMAAVQAEDYPQAIGYWERLLAALPNDSDAWKSVNGHLQDVRAQAGLPATETVAETTPETAEPAPAVAAPATENAPAAAPGSLSIQVDLSEALKARAPADATVFIYARAAQGPRMPLAIVTRQVKDLPVSVTLDDSMAMMPNMRLSAFPQVIAAARVAFAGSAMPQRGDLIGESAPLAPAQQSGAVPIEIDRVIQ